MALQTNLYRRNTTPRKALLYTLVFKGKLSNLTVFLLFMSFMVQPFNQAYANVEEEVSPEVGVAEEVRQQEEVVEENVEVKEEESVPEQIQESDAEREDENPSDQSDEGATDVQDESETESQENKNSTSTEETVDSDAKNATTSDQNSEGDDGSMSQLEVSGETEEQVDPSVDNEPTQTDEADGETDIDELESTELQQLAKETVRQIESLVNDQNFYQFSRQACVPVGNGAYHCTQNDGEEFDEESVVYADRGESGNLEIFLKTSRGKVEQITDNKYDDSAPHYDPASKKVVWQRLVNDRYQIVMYDIEESEEYQLTFSRTNNMEPEASLDGVTWQAWDGNDWEIMYFDGTFTDQITDNTVQDVSPVIEDGYILWTVIGEDSQEARVYSLENKEILSITSHEGGAIANPRFVLVYDTKFENGDVVTQGFDPETGLSAPIAAQPAPEPIDIPVVDPIGEVRALINNKSTDEDEFVPDEQISNSTGTSTASSTSDVLNLAPVSSDVDTQADDSLASTSPAFELDEYDLPVVFVDLSEEGEEEETEPETGDLILTASSTQS